MVIVIIIILAGIFVGVIMAGNSKERTEQLKEMGLDLTKAIQTKKYLHGHPEINMPLENTFIMDKGNIFEIYQDDLNYNQWSAPLPHKIGEIEKKSIEDIVLEDASSMEKRVTITRLALTGIFAFALRKKQKNELIYLIVRWRQGQFLNETIFEFEGNSSLMYANEARNALIKTFNTYKQ